MIREKVGREDGEEGKIRERRKRRMRGYNGGGGGQPGVRRKEMGKEGKGKETISRDNYFVVC